MEEITLQQLLEAGCHFGHKSERWHPHASEFIYTEKDGIHIIDLAKTKAGLEAAAKFVRDTVAAGDEVLFVATKPQAKGVVRDAVLKAGAPFFVERWIGGFLTNWDEIRKNITKANRMAIEQTNGSWKIFPKHEQVKLAQHLKRLNLFYEGVLTIKTVPKAIFIIDVRKEIAAVREAKRREIPIIGVVDTNSDPRGINYVIPANDDAVGSIQIVTETIANAYAEGMKMRQKAEENAVKAAANSVSEQAAKAQKSETKTPNQPVVKANKEPEIVTGVDVKTKVEAVVTVKPEKANAKAVTKAVEANKAIPPKEAVEAKKAIPATKATETTKAIKEKEKMKPVKASVKTEDKKPAAAK